MEINKKSRTELKAYFVKNALPTEGNFRDLIDAGLNQKDDGLVKLADQPVQIAASTAGDKPAIHLYESFATDAKPAWVLSLQAGGKKGFGIGDGDGRKCLFVDATTGDVGIGTIDPAGNKLRVAGSVLVDGADGKARVSFGSSNRQMLNLYTEGHGIGVQSSTTYFRSSSNFAFYKGGAHSDGALDPGTSGAAMLVIKDGDVGIGTVDPGGYKLKVAGNVSVTGTLRSPMWNVTQVLRQKRGPMPVSGTFQSSGGTLLVFASGSGMQHGTPAVMGMAIKLDNTQVGSANAWSNVQSAHQRFVAESLVLQGIAAGSHTIALASISNTSSDDNDYYSVTVLELPF
ncbi:hypothetical protein [Sorangium sp. So ce1151]|uniref:hypothetical protein n=1 Tax=Sorangium sp. So ce1151 TaxID=3133332 RepID=UPI003F5DB044